MEPSIDRLELREHGMKSSTWPIKTTLLIGIFDSRLGKSEWVLLFHTVGPRFSLLVELHLLNSRPIRVKTPTADPSDRSLPAIRPM